MVEDEVMTVRLVVWVSGGFSVWMEVKQVERWQYREQ